VGAGGPTWFVTRSDRAGQGGGEEGRIEWELETLLKKRILGRSKEPEYLDLHMVRDTRDNAVIIRGFEVVPW
jgi:hypothetical protein